MVLWQKGRFRAALLGLGLVFWANGAQADGYARAEFDIPAQPLAAALDTFGRQAGALGVYDGRVVGGRASSAVRGELGLNEALSALLQGTGLAAEFTSKESFVVFLRDEAGVTARRPIDIGQSALSSLDLAERGYSALLQQIVENAFCANALTRSRDYRAAISFRIDRDGVAQKVKLLGSTGDAPRDEAIVTVVSKMTVDEMPPRHMSQPFVMVVLPRASGAVLDCTQPGNRG